MLRAIGCVESCERSCHVQSDVKNFSFVLRSSFLSLPLTLSCGQAVTYIPSAIIGSIAGVSFHSAKALYTSVGPKHDRCSGSACRMEPLFISDEEAALRLHAQRAKDELAALRRDEVNLRRRAKKRVDADFTIYQKNFAMMLYDASGFRIGPPVQYLQELLGKRDHKIHEKFGKSDLLHWYNNGMMQHQKLKSGV